jgi:very-short-patch-repair endonuclease
LTNKELEPLSNKYKNSLTGISEERIAEILSYYALPKSQKETASHFCIKLHSLKRLLKTRGVARERYSVERNQILSQSIKATLKNKPEIIEARKSLHLGSKRSNESKQRMREAAWKRMHKEETRFVSKSEIAFGKFLKNKFGLSVISQYRAGLKPFDFLVDDKVLVEFDGPHHYDPNFHLCKTGKINFEKQQIRDQHRKFIAHQLGMKLVIIQQKEVDKKMQLKGDAMHEFMANLGYECA